MIYYTLLYRYNWYNLNLIIIYTCEVCLYLNPFTKAMALDGFCSFVANLAVAARIHHQEPHWGKAAKKGWDEWNSVTSSTWVENFENWRIIFFGLRMWMCVFVGLRQFEWSWNLRWSITICIMSIASNDWMLSQLSLGWSVELNQGAWPANLPWELAPIYRWDTMIHINYIYIHTWFI